MRLFVRDHGILHSFGSLDTQAAVFVPSKFWQFWRKCAAAFQSKYGTPCSIARRG
jgi:hypothetical protein